MKTSIWCTVLLACVLSKAAMAMYRMDTGCSLECALYGESHYCACDDYDQQTLLRSVDALAKRGGARLPFRFGKRGSAVKRQRLPFRYGKRSMPSSADVPGYNSMRPRSVQSMWGRVVVGRVVGLWVGVRWGGVYNMHIMCVRVCSQ